MLKLFLVCCVLSSLTIADAQEIILNQALIDSVVFQDYRRGNRLDGIYYYNKIQNKLALKDTIIVIKDKLDYRDKINNESLEYSPQTNFKSDNFSLSFSKTDGGIYMNSKCQTSDSTHYTLSIRDQREFRSDTSILIKNYMYDLIHKTENITESGKTLLKGNYMLKDSIYQDSFITFDYDTYEEILSIEERKYVPNKCGVWLSNNLAEDKIRLKIYAKCPED